MDEPIIPQQNISLSGVAGGGEIDIYTYFTASPYFAGFDTYDSPERRVFLGLYQNLSSSLREFLASDITALTIYTAGQAQNLNDEQIYTLAKLIRELILGNIFIKDFPMSISSKLSIDDIRAGSIANKIIAESFGPILEDIKRIQRNKFSEKISQIQKEALPSKLTQPSAKPLPPRTVPAAPAQAQSSQSIPPMPLPQPVQGVSPQATPSIRPPLQMSRSSEDRGSSITSQSGPPRPLQSSPPPLSSTLQQLPRQPESIRQAPQVTPPTPPRPLATPPYQQRQETRDKQQVPPMPPQGQPLPLSQTPAKPPLDSVQSNQFRVPDLGTIPPTPQQPIPPNSAPSRGGVPDIAAQKSLEEDLQKVAGIIDLRDKT